MATITLDTHKFVTTLTNAGVPEQQAEGIAKGLQEIDLKNVATKQDLAELKADIFKWAVPLLVGQVAVFTTIVGLMFSVLK